MNADFPMRFPMAERAIFEPGTAATTAADVATSLGESSSKMLCGLHGRTGQWVSLYDATGLAEQEVFMKLAGSTQPDIKRGFIRIEDFSAFRIESHVQVTWMRGKKDFPIA
jgi:hypothetical protein